MQSYEYKGIYVFKARGGAVVEALRYKPEGRDFHPGGVTGIFY
jgi:hypothetical protein